MFDSIINEALEKFNSGGQAEKILSVLLRLISNPTSGGFGGFIEKFRRAGLGETVDSWIRTGDNTPLSNEQLENALGTNTVSSIAKQAGIDQTTATPLLGFLIPRVVDNLTPDGSMPDESTVLSKISRFTKIPGNVASVGDLLKREDNDSNSGGWGGISKFAIPLLLLGLIIGIGYSLLKSASSAPTVAQTGQTLPPASPNTAVVQNLESSFKIEAKDGKYVVSGVVPDLATDDKIKARLTEQFGEGKVDFANLKVEPRAKPFAAGWWDNFAQMLPTLKDWKTGTLAFAGNSITSAIGLPAEALTQLKSLFASWTLPVSVAGAENATKQANEEALKELNSADTVEELISALNVSIINFRSGSSEIPADAKPILEKAAEFLKKQPDGTVIEIGGYTDNKGNPEGNKKLSQSRADAVKKALIGLGVQDLKLKAIGYGDANPVGDNNSEDGRFKNRRIEYKQAESNGPTASTTSNSR